MSVWSNENLEMTVRVLYIFLEALAILEICKLQLNVQCIDTNQ